MSAVSSHHIDQLGLKWRYTDSSGRNTTSRDLGQRGQYLCFEPDEDPLTAYNGPPYTEDFQLLIDVIDFQEASVDEFTNLVRDHRAALEQSGKKKNPMLERLIKLYTAYMLQDVRSPIPHMAGPAGVGKSAVARQLAELAGVQLHTINVARLSPLEIEGLLMPVDDNSRLELLLNRMWANLKEGDIVFLDEFLRGFPEVYNAMLDIITSREVAGHQLPKVFFIAASNSVATYDEALRDRLLHITVDDLRKSVTARTRAKRVFAESVGMIPEIVEATEMEDLVRDEVLPMYDMLDTFAGNARNTTTGASKKEGHSFRNLAGQVKLREIQSKPLRDLIAINNRLAIINNKMQYVILLSGRNPDPAYVKATKALEKIRGKLTEIQAINLDLNLQLISMEEATTEKSDNEKEEA